MVITPLQDSLLDGQADAPPAELAVNWVQLRSGFGSGSSCRWEGSVGGAPSAAPGDGSVRFKGNDPFKQLSIQMQHINCMKKIPMLSKHYNVRPQRPCRPLLLN